jgi:lipid A 4'-phosphatase
LQRRIFACKDRRLARSGFVSELASRDFCNLQRAGDVVGGAVGLFLILLAGAVTSIAFAVDPLLDLQLAGYFQRPDVKEFYHQINPYLAVLRDNSTAITVIFILVPLCSVAAKLIWPRTRMLIPPRACILIVLTFVLGPGLLANGILKAHWNRPRPAAVVQFGGTQPFVQWWDPRGACRRNCSFVSGEGAAAFSLLAPAVVVPAPWRYPAVAAAVAYGTGIGFVRVAVGRHFPTDIIFSGIFTALIVWLLHGFLFRWKWTRFRDESAEDLLEKTGLAIRSRFAALRGRSFFSAQTTGDNQK